MQYRSFVIPCILFVVISLGSSAIASQSRTQKAYDLLLRKGYIRSYDENRGPSSAEPTPEVMAILNKALDSFDFSAANAIAFLHKNGHPIDWAAPSSEKQSDTQKEEEGPQGQLRHILEQLYGAKGAGYIAEEKALKNASLNREIAEVYRVTEKADAGDGWYSVTLEIGTIERKSTTIPLMVNIHTGQTYENYGVEGAEATIRQAQPKTD